ncbi:LysR family transcriptional regulator, partial [Escherichia coli]|nr:LysR family transcriptional regulator [Escherichia coli]
LRVFEAAARHENFTQAAGELGMTQAAVSYQVRLLEQQLGIRLFVRERGRVRLTPAAADLARTMTGALGSISAAVRRL